MTNPAETTPISHWVVAYWDDYLSEKTVRFGRVYWPSRGEAIRAAAAEARMKGAPGQALVFAEYDVSYMADRIVVSWRTPVGSEQPPDKKVIDFDGSILKTYKVVSQRLGNIPR